MSNAEKGKEQTQVKEPTPVEEKPDVEDAPAIAKWPWWVSALTALVVLVGLGVVIVFGWDYIISHDETQEDEDYEQLLGLIDRVQTVALFVLGAILGVTVTGAAARGAASAAKKNKIEAESQHGKAKQNQRAAEANKSVAEAAKRDALSAADKLEELLGQYKSDTALGDLLGKLDPVLKLTLDPRDSSPISQLVTAGPYAEGDEVVVVKPDLVVNRSSEATVTECEEVLADVRERWS
jgi:hypothetical protein